MKGISFIAPGGPEVLQIQEFPIPKISSNEVLLKVCAAGINRPDIFQRKGNYPPPKGVVDILGLEVAGIIVEVGVEVHELKKGDRVMALLPGGGYAEYAAVDAGCCLLIPDNITMEAAAGMPETLFTVWHNIFQRGNFIKGDKVLVHGGTGGIGLTAIQLVSALGGSVYTTVGSDSKKKFIQDNFDISGAVNYQDQDFEEVFKTVGIDVILDSIGGDYFNKNINILAEDGRLVQINAMHGANVNLNLLKVMQKRLFITGSTLRSRDISFKRQIAIELQKYVLPLIADGKFETFIDSVFPYTEVVKAHTLMENRNFIGKIILRF